MRLSPILCLLLAVNTPMGTMYAAPPCHLDGESPLVEQYILKYQQYAVAEMERMGIPASIKLAKGIHESRYGQSLAAIEANNHFGIKCHTGWSGETYYQSTGEYKGNVYNTESNVCFRRYDSVEESYRDHSNFLASRAHYNFLFKLSSSDYVGWAEGLQKAGYATDPSYPEKLINIIRQYNLTRFDKAVTSIFLTTVTPAVSANAGHTAQTASNAQLQADLNGLKQKMQTFETMLTESERHLRFLSEQQTEIQKTVAEIKDQQAEFANEMNDKIVALDQAIAHQSSIVQNIQQRLRQVETVQQNLLRHDPLSAYFEEDGTPKKQLDIFPQHDLNHDMVFYQSGRRATHLKEGQNMLNVARSYGVEYADLLKFNDLEEELASYPKNFYVYLERKANTVENEPVSYHEVQPGEDTYIISQRYGVRLSRLQQMNYLRKGEEPQVGEFMFLNQNAPQKPKLRSQALPGTVTDFGSGGVGGNK